MWPSQVLLCSSWLTFSWCGVLCCVTRAARAADHTSSRQRAPRTAPHPAQGCEMFFFTSNVVDPPAFIYMGKDKCVPSPNHITTHTHHTHTHTHTHTPKDRENRLASPLTNVPRCALACALRSSGADERFDHGVRYSCDGLRVLAYERTRHTSVLLSLRGARTHTIHSRTLLSHSHSQRFQLLSGGSVACDLWLLCVCVCVCDLSRCWFTLPDQGPNVSALECSSSSS
jgi:hypothetical protein